MCSGWTRTSTSRACRACWTDCCRCRGPESLPCHSNNNNSSLQRCPPPPPLRSPAPPAPPRPPPPPLAVPPPSLGPPPPPRRAGTARWWTATVTGTSRTPASSRTQRTPRPRPSSRQASGRSCRSPPSRREPTLIVTVTVIRRQLLPKCLKTPRKVLLKMIYPSMKI